jgi:hypothetical protein
MKRVHDVASCFIQKGGKPRLVLRAWGAENHFGAQLPAALFIIDIFNFQKNLKIYIKM